MLTINAEIRKEHGKGPSRRLRKNNKLPAVVYGRGREPISIELNHNEIINKENKAELYEKLILIFNDKKEIKVKVQAVQRHPFISKLTHIDFLEII